MSSYPAGIVRSTSMGGISGFAGSIFDIACSFASSMMSLAKTVAVIGGAGLGIAGAIDAAGWASIPFVAAWGASMAPQLAAVGIGSITGAGAFAVAGVTFPMWAIPVAIAFATALGLGLANWALFGHGR